MNLAAWSAALEAALDRPVPLIRVNGKRPLDAGWTQGPFDNSDFWRGLLENYIGNVGLVLGRGLAALDIDLYQPGAEDAWESLRADTGLSAETVTQITGGGGRHYLYSYPPDLTVPSIALGHLGYPGIELKGDGGFVVVQPSKHPTTGRGYLFEHGYAPGDLAAVAFTDRFLAAVDAQPATPGRSRRARPLTDDKTDGVDPADLACARILIDHFGGHDPVRLHDGTIGIWRPGKNVESASAVVGYIGPGVAKIWSSHWPPFSQGQVCDLGQLRQMAGLAEPLYELMAERVRA